MARAGGKKTSRFSFSTTSRSTKSVPCRAESLMLYRIVVQVNRIQNARPAVLDQPRSQMNGHGGKRPGAGRPKGAASRANEQVRQEAAATGELPLAYMLRIMRDPGQPVGRRDEMAKAAAPFCHSRLSSVEHSGEISRPTVIRAPAVSAT